MGKRESYSKRFEGYALRAWCNIWLDAGKDYSTPAGQWLLDCNGNRCIRSAHQG